MSFVYDWPTSWDQFYHGFAASQGIMLEHNPSKTRVEELRGSPLPIFWAMEGGQGELWDQLEQINWANLAGADTSLPSAGRRQLARTCVAHSLFVPHRSVLADLDGLLAVVGGVDAPAETSGRAPGTLLLGLHARYGDGAIDRSGTGDLRMSPSQVDQQVECAWAMTKAWENEAGNAATHAAWLIASDRPDLFFSTVKAYTKAHPLSRASIVVLDNKAGHEKESLHIKDDASESVIRRMWLDFFMLGEATCCSYGRSGFPELACSVSSRLLASGGRNVAWTDSCSDWRNRTQAR